MADASSAGQNRKKMSSKIQKKLMRNKIRKKLIKHNIDPDEFDSEQLKKISRSTYPIEKATKIRELNWIARLPKHEREIATRLIKNHISLMDFNPEQQAIIYRSENPVEMAQRMKDGDRDRDSAMDGRKYVGLGLRLNDCGFFLTEFNEEQN